MPEKIRLVSGDEWRESVDSRQVRGGHILRAQKKEIPEQVVLINGKPTRVIDLGHALEASDVRVGDRFRLMKTKGRIIGGR